MVSRIVSVFHVSFINNTVVNSVRDDDGYLYLNTDNNGTLDFSPNVRATLNPGTLQPYSQDAGFNPQGSVLYLFGLNRILSEDQIAAIQLDGRWISQCYYDSENGHYWAFTPRSPTTIEANDVYSLALSEIHVGDGNNNPSARLDINYFNVPGLTLHHPNNKHAYITVTARKAPNTDGPPEPSATDTLRCHFRDGKTMPSYGGKNDVGFIQLSEGTDTVVNGFTLVIGPKDGQGLLHAGRSTVLFLSSISAESGFGALASQADLAGILLTKGAGAEGWEIYPRMDAKNPYWKIVIPSGQSLAGELRFDHIISQLDWGWTSLTLQVTGVEGYRDGQLDVPLYKYGRPFVEKAVASNTGIPGLGAGWNIFQLFIEWKGHSVLPLHVQCVATDPDRPWSHGGTYTVEVGDSFPESGLIKYTKPDIVTDPHVEVLDVVFSAKLPFSDEHEKQIARIQRKVPVVIRLVNETIFELDLADSNLTMGLWFDGYEPPKVLRGGQTADCVLGCEHGYAAEYRAGAEGQIVFTCAPSPISMKRVWSISFKVDMIPTWKASCEAPTDGNTEDVNGHWVTSKTEEWNPFDEYINTPDHVKNGIAWVCTFSALS